MGTFREQHRYTTQTPERPPMTTTAVAAVPTGHLPAVRLREAGGVLRSFSASLPPDRRGRLRNGNRAGDFLAAPRCCAQTRSQGACRQPAMANGRCRLHGGMSTGPRTPEGRERCRRARLTHGARSARVIALRREARAWCRRVTALRAAVNGRRPAGHGVHRSISPAAPGAGLPKVHHRDHRGAVPPSARAARNPTSSVPSVFSVVNPSSTASPAGHGVLRSFLRFAGRLLRPCLAAVRVYSPRPHNLADPRAKSWGRLGPGG